ncbi:MAG TPA: hypothetical protein PK668_24190 [Myxococcota bacterium]|nr:hypothetical protein [Myxococcota bacterium]HRY95363.1 hypothetical protein [Myxococcota bacterium]
MPNRLLWILLLGAGLAGCGDNQTIVPERDPYQSPGQEPLACLPDLDGRLDADELQTAFAVPVRYLVSPAGETRAVDVVGEVDPAGRRVWDWGADYASDQLAVVEVRELQGQWYAASFPGGQFVLPFDAGGRIESVHSRDEQGVYLHGLASAEQHPPEGQTLLPYQTPIQVNRFPLAPGDAWLSVGVVQNGVFRDLPFSSRDTYEFEVDGAGELALPDVTFTQALRVRTRTTIEPLVGQSTSQRQVSFFFECFGEVARATSQTDEPEEDFQTALEVRRLGLLP